MRRSEGSEFEPVTTAVRVLISDAYPLFLLGMRRALESQDGIEVVGQVGSVRELWSVMESCEPDVLLLDLHLAGVADLGLPSQIRDHWPTVKLVALSQSDDEPLISAALSAGATSYIVKCATPQDLVDVVRQAAAGVVYHAAPRVQSVRAGDESDQNTGTCPGLTRRERAILAAVAEGTPTREISNALWIREQTVKFHLTNIYRKLGVANRSSAVRYALKNGLVT
jgi:NarL family two-component system response regulator LiaR